MTLEQARAHSTNNEKIDKAFNTELQKFREKLVKEHNKNYVLVDDLLLRKLGVCDCYREKYPESDKTDDEIIQHYEMIEEKYENDLIKV